MEVYILDSLFRREKVVDVYESLVWTERYAAYGDFELILHSTPGNRGLFPTGTRFTINESYRVMIVETIEDTTDSEGRNVLTLRGRSLESVLEDRIARQTMANLKTTPDWVLTGLPKTVMTTMFDTIVRNPVLNPGDSIPFLQPGSIFPIDTIAEPIDPITWTQKPDTLYNALSTLGEFYGLGFRLVRNFDQSELYFDVYTGSNRTTSQTILDPVVFSPELDNLHNTTELTTIDQAKNVAYVFSNQGSLVVYAQDVDATISGFERQTLLVEADDLPDTPTADAITSHLTQKGREALSQHQPFSAFDGEISQRSSYKYGTHYNLGDMVEQRNADGVANNMRVTEQIFVSDKEGDRSYPTLTLFKYINTGSWLSWDANQVWADLDSDPVAWSELP